ncbi:glycosyltransferase [Hankyongella ginsenosidimutans]|uniref:glycosyltransferase n=1 Tax=Hankyongella ginsenosidimutans TaxID=1763828 RepID=UPI001CA31306|nr:glycosyltransferase [Hankyongella ginsenosidimutans]
MPPQPDAIPGLHKTDDTLVVGTLAGLRREKNLPRLVRAFAKAAEGLNARLVIVGEGAERVAIEAQAAACGVTDRLVMPGFSSTRRAMSGCSMCSPCRPTPSSSRSRWSRPWGRRASYCHRCRRRARNRLSGQPALRGIGGG